MDKRFLAILAGIAAIFIGVFIFTSSGDKGDNTTSNQKPTSHIKGEGKKGVTLIEYGDYQCSACFSYEPVVKQVFAKYKTDIYLQFRNLPLPIHQNARSGARAAEAAGLQNKYWEMHDKLYENQDPSGKSGWVASNDPLTFFTAFAQEIGLNVNQFKSDYASSKANAAINADIAAFNKTGLEMSTPTFFLNGKHVDNKDAGSLDSFSKVIDAEIKNQ